MVTAKIMELSTFAPRKHAAIKLWKSAISFFSAQANTYSDMLVIFTYDAVTVIIFTIKEMPPMKVNMIMKTDIKLFAQIPLPELPVLAHATGNMYPVIQNLPHIIAKLSLRHAKRRNHDVSLQAKSLDESRRNQ